MLLKCQECKRLFEPPYDPVEFKVWIDACAEVEDYLCLSCVGVDGIIGIDSIEILLEEES